MDPRVNTPMAGLQKKFRAEMHMASALTETTQAIVEGNSIRKQLEKLQTNANAQAKEAATDFQKKLDGVLGGNGEGSRATGNELTLGRVNGNAAALYGQIWQADAEPTSAQTASIGAIDHETAEVMKRWNELKSTELPALNRLLRQSQAPEIDINAHLQRVDAEMEDEE
jgi:hypothetical protein